MWYYVRDGERVGPETPEVIEGLIKSGIIKPDTLVWKEGLADWIPAKTTELNAQFGGPAAPPSVAGAEVPSAPAAPAPAGPVGYIPYEPKSFKSMWLWYAWLLGAGAPLCIVLIGIPALFAGLVIFYILLYRFWVIIQGGNARTTPGQAVGFCFIPFFNFYWFYVAMVGLAEDMNSFCDERQIDGPRVSRELVLGYYITMLCTMIPYLGILVAIAAMVLQIIAMKQFSDVATAIAEQSAQER